MARISFRGLTSAARGLPKPRKPDIPRHLFPLLPACAFGVLLFFTASTASVTSLLEDRHVILQPELANSIGFGCGLFVISGILRYAYPRFPGVRVFCFALITICLALYPFVLLPHLQTLLLVDSMCLTWIKTVGESIPRWFQGSTSWNAWPLTTLGLKICLLLGTQYLRWASCASSFVPALLHLLQTAGIAIVTAGAAGTSVSIRGWFVPWLLLVHFSIGSSRVYSRALRFIRTILVFIPEACFEMLTAVAFQESAAAALPDRVSEFLHTLPWPLAQQNYSEQFTRELLALLLVSVAFSRWMLRRSTASFLCPQLPLAFYGFALLFRAKSVIATGVFLAFWLPLQIGWLGTRLKRVAIVFGTVSRTGTALWIMLLTSFGASSTATMRTAIMTMSGVTLGWSKPIQEHFCIVDAFNPLSTSATSFLHASNLVYGNVSCSLESDSRPLGTFEVAGLTLLSWSLLCLVTSMLWYHMRKSTPSWHWPDCWRRSMQAVGGSVMATFSVLLAVWLVAAFPKPWIPFSGNTEEDQTMENPPLINSWLLLLVIVLRGSSVPHAEAATPARSKKATKTRNPRKSGPKHQNKGNSGTYKPSPAWKPSREPKTTDRGIGTAPLPLPPRNRYTEAEYVMAAGWTEPSQHFQSYNPMTRHGFHQEPIIEPVASRADPFTYSAMFGTEQSEPFEGSGETTTRSTAVSPHPWRTRGNSFHSHNHSQPSNDDESTFDMLRTLRSELRTPGKTPGRDGYRADTPTEIQPGYEASPSPTFSETEDPSYHGSHAQYNGRPTDLHRHMRNEQAHNKRLPAGTGESRHSRPPRPPISTGAHAVPHMTRAATRLQQNHVNGRPVASAAAPMRDSVYLHDRLDSDGDVDMRPQPPRQSHPPVNASNFGHEVHQPVPQRPQTSSRAPSDDFMVRSFEQVGQLLLSPDHSNPGSGSFTSRKRPWEYEIGGEAARRRTFPW